MLVLVAAARITCGEDLLQLSKNKTKETRSSAHHENKEDLPGFNVCTLFTRQDASASNSTSALQLHSILIITMFCFNHEREG